MTRLGRWVAIVIALAGVIDPSVMLARTPPLTVSVLGASDHPALADRVTRLLSGVAEVESGLSADAAGVVTLDDEIPVLAPGITVPAFAVAESDPSIAIDDLRAASRAPLDARVPVEVRVHVRGGQGQVLTVDLSSDGARLDQADRPIAGPDVRLVVPLTFVPAQMGVARLHVSASLKAGGGSSVGRPATADTLVSVDRTPWAVLVFDRRPSWMSTFVRRALEEDDRFAVTSRTVTSRSVATDTPNAPGGLADVAALSRFDVIVVGAPDALTRADLAGLEAFLRRRGGAVVALWDARPSGPALALMGVRTWLADTRNADRPLQLAGGLLRVSDIAWPSTLPDRAEPLGRVSESTATGPSTVEGPAVVWRVPVGDGELVVSGALDSWRYRTAGTFDAAWQQVIATAAGAAAPPLAVTLNQAVVPPGHAVRAHVQVRTLEASMASTMRLHLSAVSRRGEDLPVRVWPDGPGGFVAYLDAPRAAGVYELTATTGEITGRVLLVVDETATAPGHDQLDALAAWTSSRGGRLFEAGAADALPAAIRGLGAARPVREAVHPMRSPWWIAPVTLLLGIDWLTRRRRGLR